MTRKRTAEEIESAKQTIRKYSGRIASMEDWADLLEITKSQLKYTFDSMNPEEAKEIKRKTAHLNKMQKNLENWEKLCFSTDDKLGITCKKNRKVGKFIDPLTFPTILNEGTFSPRRYDILYVVEEANGHVYFRKYLVDSVSTKGSNFLIQALLIAKANVKTEFLNFLEGFDGVDRYILSII